MARKEISRPKTLSNLFIIFSFILFSAIGGPPASAQETAQTSNEIFVAPVVVEGEVLFQLRGISSLPANERAEEVAQRIIAVAESSGKLSVEIDVEEHPFGKAILIGGELIVVASKPDAALEGISVEVLAEGHVEAIREAIVNYRASRTQSARINSALYALVWTLGFGIVSYLFFRRRERFVGRIGRLVERQFEDVEHATKSIVKGRAIAGLVRFAMQILLWTLYLVLFYYFVSLVLLSIAETRPIANLLLTYITDPLIDILRGFLDYLPSLITLIIIVFITRYVLSGVKVLFENIEAGVLEISNFEKHWVTPSYFLARIVIIAIALVFSYPHIPGSDSAAFQGLTIIAGVMVSLGSNTVVSNMMAGLFVVYRRSTNVGDRIKVGDQVGDVIEIKLMETILKSVKNELISIPNSKLLNSEVINYTREIDGRGLLVHTTVGIGYEEPPEKIKKMLIEAARSTTGLKKSPPPFVLWTKLGDYAINYEINAFTTRGSSLPKLLSDLHENIATIFHENGTQIMTPSYIADTDPPKIPPQDWDGVLAGEEKDQSA